MIIASAIKQGDNLYFEDKSHSTISMKYNLFQPFETGFINENFQFVNRIDAMIDAKEYDQVNTKDIVLNSFHIEMDWSQNKRLQKLKEIINEIEFKIERPLYSFFKGQVVLFEEKDCIVDKMFYNKMIYIIKREKDFIFVPWFKLHLKTINSKLNEIRKFDKLLNS